MGSLRTLRSVDEITRLRVKTSRLIPPEIFEAGFILKSHNVYPPNVNFGFYHEKCDRDTISLFLHTIFQSFYLTFDVDGNTKLYHRGDYKNPKNLNFAAKLVLTQWKRLFERV